MKIIQLIKVSEKIKEFEEQISSLTKLIDSHQNEYDLLKGWIGNSIMVRRKYQLDRDIDQLAKAHQNFQSDLKFWSNMKDQYGILIELNRNELRNTIRAMMPNAAKFTHQDLLDTFLDQQLGEIKSWCIENNIVLNGPTIGPENLWDWMDKDPCILCGLTSKEESNMLLFKLRWL